MEDAPVTAATGALGPVIAKLAALLGSEYKLRCRTRRDISFIRSKLKPIHSILWNIWEREELDEASKALKMEVLDLADELDDAIFDFILSLERSRNNKRLVQTNIKESPFHDFKKRASDVSGRCRRKWKEKKEKPAADDSRPGKPRAYPFVRKDASELVGMARQRDKLIQHLVGEDETTPTELQLKAAFIYGTSGMTKTTLADLVYQAIGDKFDSRAFVSVTRPGGNMREVLARILQQVEANSSVPLAGTEASTEEHLIDTISNFLKDKRYLVIIDDIWNWREWEVIMKSLPENNLGSRIVETTRINDVAKKWDKDSGYNAVIHKILPQWQYSAERWDNYILVENIATGMVAMKADLVAEGFDNEHPIMHMCGGMPLAVRCMLSAVAQEREKQAQQGLHAKACDVQDEIEKHVKENGIQNTPGFEPLVESLQLGYDDLPHHMLKTCLLYCSIYRENHVYEKDDVVWRWIFEGFVYTQQEANGYFEELVNRGLILPDGLSSCRMHPMMRNFLRWKSRQDNFTTCSSEITPSSRRIRSLCMDESRVAAAAAEADPLSALDWYHIRSLVVSQGIERIPFEKLEGVRLLDLRRTMHLQDHHLKDICGLVRLRHLLVLNQRSETFGPSARLPGFIGDLQQLKTLEVIGPGIKELPREIGALRQLQTLRIRDTNIAELPSEIGALQQLETLDMQFSYKIMELPKEIGKLQQLRILDISHTYITVLPKEMTELQQLKTLDISNTSITVLPREIGKLQHLEHLVMNGTMVAKIPREIGALKELKSLSLDNTGVALPLEVCGALVELPECIHKAVNKIGLVSDLAGEMLSFQRSQLGQEGGLAVGAKQMHIPPWIREHFNDLAMLDIRICKLEEGGLKILREMPRLWELTLRFEVVPREPVVISSQGFAKLWILTIDSRVPRVTFQEGAMPKLMWLTFQFQFYAGQPNKDPMGINHLTSLDWIKFECNEDWYSGADSPCIRPTIDVVRKEAHKVAFHVCGRREEICKPPPSPPPPLEMGQQRERRRWRRRRRSSAVGEIEEDIQA